MCNNANIPEGAFLPGVPHHIVEVVCCGKSEWYSVGGWFRIDPQDALISAREKFPDAETIHIFNPKHPRNYAIVGMVRALS